MIRTICAEVYNQLKGGIIRGVYPMGARITINEIAQKYNISHLPVRETLNKLAGERLVEIVPHYGARVFFPTEQFIRDIYALRAWLECMFIRNSIPIFTKDDIAELKALNKDYKDTANPKNVFLLRKKNLKFHYMMFKYNTNVEARLIYDSYSGEGGVIAIIMNQFGISGRRVEQVIAEHDKYVRLITRKDIPALEELSKKHAEGALKDVLDNASAQNYFQRSAI
jgi:DNA-binding GntR family transcriptional regulator